MDDIRPILVQPIPPTMALFYCAANIEISYVVLLLLLRLPRAVFGEQRKEYSPAM